MRNYRYQDGCWNCRYREVSPDRFPDDVTPIYLTCKLREDPDDHTPVKPHGVCDFHQRLKDRIDNRSFVRIEMWI